MTTKDHKKHTTLTKPTGGNFHRQEWAIMGAPCDVIQRLSRQIVIGLPNLKIGYSDAAHGSDEQPEVFSTKYTDKISWHQLNFHSDPIEYKFHMFFSDADAVLLNGNHFIGDQQIVIINQKKKDSLKKKLDRLTNVTSFILDEGELTVHEFLMEYNPKFANLPVFSITDLDSIIQFISDGIQSSRPSVNGLILAGGKSKRMGLDKRMINYHGKPQVEFAAEMLAKYCDKTFISIEENTTIQSGYPTIEDTFTGLGPMGGILSAFRFDPNTAWLTIAADIPLLNRETIDFLIQNRNPGKVATCFHNDQTDFPEPLITIWEPKAYQVLLHFLSKGYSCPRKVLINSDVHQVSPPDPAAITNVNTPEELAKVQKIIQQG